MIIHVLVDIPKEHTRNDRYRPERDRHEIHIAIAFGISHLAGLDDNAVGGFIGADARDHLQILKEGGARQFNCRFYPVSRVVS